MKQKERLAELEAIAEQSYNQLDGEWKDWLEVAKRYERKALYQDRQDIRHDIILELHRARHRDNKPIPQLRAYRIASLTVALYWRQLKRQPTLLSLDSDIADSEGHLTRLKETVADDNAIDLDQWLDDGTWLLGCPLRLIEIASKKVNGEALSWKDHKYWERELRKQRAKYQKSLF